jgi:uncharacterized membrane protein
MGVPTIDGFTATIMYLANLGYISLRDVKSEESKLLGLFKTESEDVLIEIFDNGSYNNTKEKIGNREYRRELEDFEKGALNLLKSHAYGDKTSWRPRIKLPIRDNFIMILL